MKIELRNVKHAKFASEETECFQAVIYLDGIEVGSVSNEGHGGCNYYTNPTTRERLNVYGKTLPKRVTKYKKDDGSFYELDYDADILIGDALIRALESKRLKTMLRTKVVMLDAGKIYTLRVEPFSIAGVKIKYPTAKILNELPFEEALDTFLENA